MFYVSMTDKFFSNGPLAPGKIAKYVYECRNMEEALTVARNAKDRRDQKHVNICSRLPRYSAKTHVVKYRTRADDPTFYASDRPFLRGE